MRIHLVAFLNHGKKLLGSTVAELIGTLLLCILILGKVIAVRDGMFTALNIQKKE